MQWSKLKKRIESTICDSLKGRVTFHSTRYRGSHDEEGRAWIALDNVSIHDFCTIKRLYKYNTLADQIRVQSNSTDWTNSEQKSDYYKAYEIADEIMEAQGIHNQYEFYKAIEKYLTLSMNDAIQSQNPIIRAVSVFDKRVGKRRLMNMKEEENVIVNKFLKIRLKAEGLIDDEGNFV